MSGIRIDAESKSNAARADLEKLNRKIGDVAKNARFSGSALDKLFGRRKNNNLQKETEGARESFKSLEKDSTKSLGKVDRSMSKSTDMMKGLRNTALAVGSAFTAIAATNAFNKAADNLTDVQNRLKLVENSTVNVLRAQQKLYQLSKDTRSELRNNVSLYVDLTKASERMGFGQERVISSLKTLQQMAVLSGTSIEGMKAAFVQLGQGLASGTLRGEELNSVMEQFKVLSFALQKETGKNAGALREFASKGSLGAEIIFSALKNEAEATQAAFDRTMLKADQGVERLSGAISLFSGELNQTLGTSRKFAQRLVVISQSIDDATLSVNSSLSALILQYNNFRRSFLVEDDKFRAAKAFIAHADSIDDVVFAYQNYGKAKKYVERLRNFFRPEEASIAAKDTAEAARELRTIGSGSLTFKVDEGIFEKVADEATKTFRYMAKQAALVAYEIGRVFGTIGGKILGVLGDSSLAVEPVLVSMTQQLEKIAIITEAKLSKGLRPFLRDIEAINDTLSVSRLGQNIERSFVDIFRADGLEDLKDRIKDFNSELASGPTRNWPVIFRSLEVSASRAAAPFRDLAIELGIIENRFLFLRNTRFDKLLETVNALGRSFRMLATDIIAPNLRILLAPAIASIRAFSRVVVDILSNTFNESFGEKLGNLVVDSAVGLGGLLAGAGESIANALFDGASLATQAVAGVGKALQGIFAFLRGFSTVVAENLVRGFSRAFELLFESSVFTRLTESVAAFAEKVSDTLRLDVAFDAMPDLNFVGNPDTYTDFYAAMVEKIKSLTSVLINEVPRMIADFGRKVKAVFFDIYDAVVGNSYWPDMIDGVVGYTSNLDKALSKISDFGTAVKDAFQGLASRIAGFFEEVGINLRGVLETVITADWGRVFTSLAGNLAAIVAASIALFHSNLLLQIGTVGLLTQIVGDAFDVDASTLFGGMTELFGTLAGHVGGAFIVGITAAIDFMLAAFPVAIGNMISGVLNAVTGDLPIVGDVLGKVFEIAVSNSVLTGLTVGTLAYMKLFHKKGVLDGIKDLFLGPEISDKPPKKRAGGLAAGLANFIPDKDFRPKGEFGNALTKGFGISGGLAAASFASAFVFDSVGLLEASFVGIPLLLNQYLGPEKFGLLFRQTSEVVFQTFKNAFSGVAKFAKSVFQGSFLEEMLSPVTSGITSFFAAASKKKADLAARAAASPFAGVATTFSDDILEVGSDIVGNIKSGRSKYVKGELSLGQLIFGQRLLALSDLKSAFSKLKDTFAAGFGPLLDSIFLFRLKMGEALGPRGVLGRLGASIGGTAVAVFDIIRESLAIAVRAFRAGFGVLARIATSRSGIIIGGVALLFGAFSAFAGVDSAGVLRDTTSEIGRLVAVSAGIGVAVTALGLLTNAFKDFSKARNAVFAKAAGAAQLAAKPELLKDFTANRELFGADVASDIFDEQMAGIAKNSRSGVKGQAFSAGLDAATAGFGRVKAAALDFKKHIMNMLHAVTPAISLLASAVGNTLFAAFQSIGPVLNATLGSTQAIFGKMFKNTGQAMAGEMRATEAFFDIGEILSNLGTKVFRSFKDNLTLMFASIGPAIRSSVEGLIQIVRATVAAGVGAIRATLRTLFRLIGVKSLIVGGVAVVGGSVALLLFGPEGTFGEKLEWAIDKVKELFGLQPKGGLVRFGKILDSLNKGLTDVGDVNNVKYAAASVDAGTLTPAQFKRFDKFSAEIGQTLEQMDQLRFQQGGVLTPSQVKELSRATDSFIRAVARLPQNDLTPLDFAFKDSIALLEKRDESYFRALDKLLSSGEGLDGDLSAKRILEGLERRAAEEQTFWSYMSQTWDLAVLQLTAIANKVYGFTAPGLIGKAVNGESTVLLNKIAEVFEDFTTLRTVGDGYASELKSFELLLRDFNKQGLLTGEELEALTTDLLNFRRTAQTATETADAADRDPGNPVKAELASQALDDQIQSERALRKKLLTQTNVSAVKFASNLFTDVQKKVIENIKITGVDIKSTDLITGEAFQDLKRIGERAAERSNRLSTESPVLDEFAQFESNMIEALNRREVEFVKKYSEEGAFFAGRVKQLASAGDLKFGEETAIGFQTASFEMSSLVNAALDMANEAEFALGQLEGDASPAQIRTAYENLFEAQGLALAAVAEGKGLFNLNEIMKQAGVEELPLIFGTVVTDAAQEQLKRQALALAAAERSLREARINGEGEGGAIVDVLAARRRAEMGRGKLDVATVTGLSDSFGNLRNIVFDVAEILGASVPDGILKSADRTRQWMAIQIKLKEAIVDLAEPGNSDERVENLSASIARYNAELKTLSESNSFTQVLAGLAETGMDVTAKGFNKLSEKTQKELTKQAETLATIYAEREDGPLTGAALESNLAREEVELKKMRKRLTGALFADADSVLNALSRFGVDSARVIAEAPSKMLNALLDAGTRFDQLQLDLSEAILKGDKPEIRRILFEQAEIKKGAEETADTINNTLSQSLESLRSVVDVDLSMEIAATLPASVRSFFKEMGLAFKQAQQDLEDGLLTASQAASLASLKDSFSGIAGALVTAKGALDTIAKSARAGIGSMFEKISSGTATISAEMVAFARRPALQNDVLFAKTTALDALGTISLADNLPDGVVDIINSRAGLDPSKTLKMIEEETGKGFKVLMESSGTQKLTGAIERLTSAILNEATKTGDGEKPESTGARVSGDALEAQRRSGIRLKDSLLSARLDGLTDKFSKVSLLAEHLGVTVENLANASPAELDTLHKTLQKLRESQKAYNLSLGEGDDKVRDASAAMAALGIDLDKLIVSLNAAAAAGKNFDTGMRGEFQNALSSWLVDFDNASFSRAIADTFTKGVLDAFSEGFTESLFKGVFGNFFENIGSNVFKTGDKGGGLLSGLLGGNDSKGDSISDYTGDAFSEWTSGESAEDPTAGFFTKLTTGFSDVMGYLSTDFFGAIGDGFMSLARGISGMLATLLSGGSGGGGGGLFGLAATVLGAFAGGGAMGADVDSMISTSGLFAKGGRISGKGTGVSDSIPIWASNGEFMINAKDTQKNLGLLHAINNGESFSMFAEGGLISPRGSNSVNDLPSERMRGSSLSGSQIINVNITGDISRQTKSEIYRMLPSIAQGVNMHNREKGSRG